MRSPFPWQPPILVTGAHRSGTTWVGRMLTASREAVYINEPLSPQHRRGVFAAPTTHWYEYICPDNERRYLDAFRHTLTFRYRWRAEVPTLRSPRDVARMFRDMARFARGRQRRLRPLLKDPFAVFSVPWFTQRLGAQAVVLVRHPAALVSSWLRLGWVVPPWRLWKQPLLVRDWLAPYEEVMRQAQREADPLITGATLWRIIFGVVHHYRAQANTLVVRYEDLALDPEPTFGRLYEFLGLRYTPQAQALIRRSTQAKAAETDPRHPHTVRLNSQAAAQAWKQRLSAAEIARIRQWVEPVASYYYTDEDW